MKEYYSSVDFKKALKMDAHTHYHTFDDFFVRKAKKANMGLITINTNFERLPIDTQSEISQSLHQRYPETFNFIATFDASAFASKSFVEDTISQLKNCIASGARGVKIWKNIGMTLRNEAGQYIMADDPVFAPIFGFLEKEKIPLLAHLGEPRNCWMPIEQMTTRSDARYFSKNPHYHMYLHPEVPSFEQHNIARDHILERYPNLIFVGAHLGSMDWNLDEVAKRMDRFPNFNVDISGRFHHIVQLATRNRDQVIDFFNKYQNRIIYGLDYFVSQDYSQKWMSFFCHCFPQLYHHLLFEYLCRKIKQHWLFFATNKMVNTKAICNQSEAPSKILGLNLTKKVVDRIFYENALSIYFNQ